jgi:ABC-2 type transport system permease protein
MQKILDIAFKDLRLISRDWMGMFFIFFFPLMMGLLFGFVFGDVSPDNAELELAVVDHDQSEMSGKFLAALGETGNVDLAIRQDEEAALDDVRRGRIAGLLIIPKGYGDTAGIFWPQDESDTKPLQIAADPSRKAETGMLEGLIMQASGKLMADRFSSAASMKELGEKLEQQIQQVAGEADVPMAGLQFFRQGMDAMGDWLDQQEAAGGETGPPGGFEFVNIERIDVTRERTPEQQQLAGLRSPWDISFPSAILWGVLGVVAAFAVSIVKERSGGTLTRLQVAPISRVHVLGGKATACFLTVIAVNAVLITIGYAFGMRPQSLPLLVLAVLCMAVCFVGIMMVMSVIGKTEEAVGGAGWGVNVVMAMFGGGMMPLAFMPGFMKTLSNFSPVKWGVLSLEGAIWRGFTLAEMLLPCAVLIAIGIAGFLLGAWILNRRQAL